MHPDHNGPLYHYTRTGRKVFLDTLTPADISLYDIAWRLSVEPRWRGETLYPWSVAAHSLLMYDEAMRRNVGLPSGVLAAVLMHDAHEAYVKDLPADIKHRPELAGYCALCDKVQAVIDCKYGLPTGEPLVKELDKWAARVEWAELGYPATRQELCPPRTHWHDYTRFATVAKSLGISD